MRWHKLPNGSLVDLERIIAVEVDYKSTTGTTFYTIHLEGGNSITIGLNFSIDDLFAVLTRYRSTQNVHRTT